MDVDNQEAVIHLQRVGHSNGTDEPSDLVPRRALSNSFSYRVGRRVGREAGRSHANEEGVAAGRDTPWRTLCGCAFSIYATGGSDATPQVNYNFPNFPI